MKTFWDELTGDFRSGKPLVIWGALTLVVSISGPFGTYRLMDLPQRALFWALIMALAILAGSILRAIAFGLLGLRGFLPASPLIAVSLAAIIPGIVHLLACMPPFHIEAALPGCLEIAVFTALCSLSVGAYRHAMSRGLAASGFATLVQADEMAASDDAQMPRPRLLDRLTDAAGSTVLSISVRDHYVDVRTDTGTFSLLMRLSDAIAETEGLEGAQVHRSHWVAWAAVVAAHRSGQKVWLQLSDGSAVPVSKTYRGRVEARGIGIGKTDAVPQANASASAPINDESAGSEHHNPPV